MKLHQEVIKTMEKVKITYEDWKQHNFYDLIDRFLESKDREFKEYCKTIYNKYGKRNVNTEVKNLNMN